ncbi:MAG TPA: transporter substrate-binding domain-containing protein [Aestuariivirga sp.]
MRKFTLLFASWLALLLALPTTLYADIRFGVAAEPYPPFTFKDASGNWVGWEIDFMKALCEKLAEKCQAVEVSWEGIIPALNAGHFDVILASMAITEKRKAVLNFSDVYYNSSPQLAAAKNTPAYHDAHDLSGKRVGVQGASIHAAYAEKHFASAGAVIKTYAKQDDAVADLAAGRIDYVMADALALDAFLQTPSGACCTIVGAVAPDPDLFGPGVGLGLRKDDTALLKRLNGALAELVKSNALETITQKWHLENKIILPSAQ